MPGPWWWTVWLLRVQLCKCYAAIFPQKHGFPYLHFIFHGRNCDGNTPRRQPIAIAAWPNTIAWRAWSSSVSFLIQPAPWLGPRLLLGWLVYPIPIWGLGSTATGLQQRWYMYLQGTTRVHEYSEQGSRILSTYTTWSRCVVFNWWQCSTTYEKFRVLSDVGVTRDRWLWSISWYYVVAVNSFIACFCFDAVTFVAASHGKSFVVVFCWAWPRLSCCFAALETKRKSGWGICGSSWVVLLWFCLMICLFHRYRPIVLSTAFFTAYVVIRTVPQSINGQTRGKKKKVWLRCQERKTRRRCVWEIQRGGGE